MCACFLTASVVSHLWPHPGGQPPVCPPCVCVSLQRERSGAQLADASPLSPTRLRLRIISAPYSLSAADPRAGFV